MVAIQAFNWLPGRYHSYCSFSVANYPTTIWVSSSVEGFFGTGCAFALQRPSAQRGRERAERCTATRGASKPIAIDGSGSDGSAEGARPLAFFLSRLLHEQNEAK